MLYAVMAVSAALATVFFIMLMREYIFMRKYGKKKNPYESYIQKIKTGRYLDLFAICFIIFLVALLLTLLR